VLVERIETLGEFFVKAPVSGVENGRGDLNNAGVVDGASVVNGGKVADGKSSVSDASVAIGENSVGGASDADGENDVSGASVQTVWKSCGVPSAAQVRESAIAQGCNATDVARLIYRRDALALLENSVRHAQDTSRHGFIWSDNSLHSALELADGERTYGEIFNTLNPLPQ
ncbi:MAG: hypothetical protein WCQ03_02950, partial [Phycisphaerae bacterium]